MRSPHPRLPLRHAGLVLLLLGMALGRAIVFAGPAAAHTDLVASDPSEGAVLDRPPEIVTVTFSEEMDPALSFVSLSVDGGSATPMVVRGGPNPTELLATPDPGSFLSEALSYTVRYRVTSLDGHPVVGEVSFSLGDTSPETGSAAPRASPSSPPSSSDPPNDAAGVDGTTPDQSDGEVPRDAEEGPRLLGLLVPGLVILLVLVLALIVALGRVFRPAEIEPAPELQQSEPAAADSADGPEE